MGREPPAEPKVDQWWPCHGSYNACFHPDCPGHTRRMLATLEPDHTSTPVSCLLVTGSRSDQQRSGGVIVLPRRRGHPTSIDARPIAVDLCRQARLLSGEGFRALGGIGLEPAL